MRVKNIISFLSIITISAIIGCGDSGDGGNSTPLEPTLSSIQTNIFEKSCAFATCHGDFDTQQGLNLTFGKSWENLHNVDSNEKSGVRRVAPLEPENSYLIWKIEGNSNIEGDRMPLNVPSLTDEEIDIIKEWISNGALND